MKVVFLAPVYPWRPVGGMRVVYEYANRLVSRGHEVAVVHSRQRSKPGWNPTFRSRIRSGLRLIRDTLFRPREIAWQSLDDRVGMLYVPRIAPEHVPPGDVVVATAWWTAELLHDFPAGHGSRFYLIQHYEDWAGPRDAVDRTWRYPMRKVVSSKWLLDVGEELGVSEDRIRHIPYGIDHDRYRLTRPIEGRGPAVAMLYHDAPWKGLEDGLAALRRVKERVPELEAVLFGAAPATRTLPDWIRYHEDPPQERIVEEIYNGSAVFLCPSWSEGWGLPGAEAMKCGCALVSTDNGGVRDYAEHGETALLAPPRDVDALAGHVIRLLEDTPYRIEMARRGQEQIGRFRWERAADRFEEWMLDAVSVGTPGA